MAVVIHVVPSKSDPPRYTPTGIVERKKKGYFLMGQSVCYCRLSESDNKKYRKGLHPGSNDALVFVVEVVIAVAVAD